MRIQQHSQIYGVAPFEVVYETYGTEELGLE